MAQTILVTGGTGYIGSHTCVELLDNGFDIVIVDNLSNSKIEALRRIETITGKAPLFYQADITDAAALAASSKTTVSTPSFILPA